MTPKVTAMPRAPVHLYVSSNAGTPSSAGLGPKSEPIGKSGAMRAHARAATQAGCAELETNSPVPNRRGVASSMTGGADSGSAGAHEDAQPMLAQEAGTAISGAVLHLA